MPPPQWFGGRQKNSWAAESGLELPLLDRSASSDGDGGDESGSRSARAEAQVAWQRTQYTAGLVLLSGAFMIEGGENYWINHVDPIYDNRHDLKVYGGLYVAYAILQTVGLMLMATSTADANLHVRQNQVLAAFVAVAIVVYSGLESVKEGTDTVHLVSGDCGFAAFWLLRAQ